MIIHLLEVATQKFAYFYLSSEDERGIIVIMVSLRWRVSKLIFARVKNDHFQYGELQSLTVANGHLNILYLVKGVCQPSFIR